MSENHKCFEGNKIGSGSCGSEWEKTVLIAVVRKDLSKVTFELVSEKGEGFSLWRSEGRVFLSGGTTNAWRWYQARVHKPKEAQWGWALMKDKWGHSLGQITWGLIVQRPLACIFQVHWKAIGIFVRPGVIGPDLRWLWGRLAKRKKKAGRPVKKVWRVE